MITPEAMWQSRMDALRDDLIRVQELLKAEALTHRSNLTGKFVAPLSGLSTEVANLQHTADHNPVSAPLWNDLSKLSQRSQYEIEAQLEILGGLIIQQGVISTDSYTGNAGCHQGFDNGFSQKAEEWLNAIRTAIGLDRQLTVLVGRGPVLDFPKGIVRLPFLDWDLWHLPFLGRAIGLLAAEEYRADVERVSASFWKETTVEELTHLNDEQRRAFLDHLLADIVATAVVGPAYAIANFFLEFDYLCPQQLSLENPELIEGRERAERYLPAPIHRAAAMLATLKAMDQAEVRPSWQREGPYTEIIERLEKEWQECVAAAEQVADLKAMLEILAPGYELLFGQIIQPLISTKFPTWKQRWDAANQWFASFCGQGAGATTGLPELTALVSAMWLHRLTYPDQADNLLSMVEPIRRGYVVPLTGSPMSSWPATVFDGRLSSLAKRCDRLQNILQSEQIPDVDRTAVVGRFYQLLSKQIYHREMIQCRLKDTPVDKALWCDLQKAEDEMRFLQREALEFLGGLFIHNTDPKLDREPMQITHSEVGPSICDLADALLRDLARCTGVNWNARTVLGQAPFWAPVTDVIRIRFPDWSVWNLPLMAHEFGHVVAWATPAFRSFWAKQSECPARLQHLDEFFADIFATYVFGPAFAYNTILLHFNPQEAYELRGSHPTHDERVQVILMTLQSLNEATRHDQWDQNLYHRICKQLQELWQQAKAICDAEPRSQSAYARQLQQSERWAGELYQMIDMYYRLGARYQPEQWDFAKELSKQSDNRPLPTVRVIEQMAKIKKLDEYRLVDLLNALWIARIKLIDNEGDLSGLAMAANTLCSDYLRGEQ